MGSVIRQVVFEHFAVRVKKLGGGTKCCSSHLKAAPSGQ